jgi:hypothetical protein
MGSKLESETKIQWIEHPSISLLLQILVHVNTTLTTDNSVFLLIGVQPEKCPSRDKHTACLHCNVSTKALSYVSDHKRATLMT